MIKQLKACKWMPNRKVTSNRKFAGFNDIRNRKKSPYAAGTGGTKINDWNPKLISYITSKTANDSIYYDASQGKPSFGAEFI